MKKIFTLIVTACLFSAVGFTQSVPAGMKYQAVARNLNGEVLSNEPISLKINLVSHGAQGQKVHYSEVHDLKTSELGLFTLVIGEGRKNGGTFFQVPWSTEDIWMEVSISSKGNSFSVVSNSKLLAVPYAFHAATANQITGNSGGGDVKSAAAGVPANVWSLKGNSKTNPLTDKLGTTDFADLVIVTNNIERLRILSNGDINLAQSLTIGDDLYVKKNVYLNTEGGETINNGPFSVSNNSPTDLSGTLNTDGAATFKNTMDIDGSTNLNSSLSVNNQSPVSLTGTLTVDGASTLKNTLDVTGNTHLKSVFTADGIANLKSILNVDGASNLKNSLTVDGAAVLKSTLDVSGKVRFRDSLILDKSINVAGSMNAAGLEVTDDASGHLATFTNTNNGNGDGILIKLGKTHPTWNGSAYLQVSNPGPQGIQTQVDQIRDWVYGNDSFSPEDLVNLLPSQYMAGTVCNLTNYVTKNINNSLGLPYKIGPFSTPSTYIWSETTIFGGLDLGALGDIPKLQIPGLTLPSMNVMPSITAMPKIPELSCGNLPTLNWPTISKTSVSNSLSKSNEFMTFADKDGRVLGSIRAQSIENFSYDYFDGVRLLGLVEQMVGLDILKDMLGVIAGVSEIIDDYNSIGVEYSSGNGDYAEWLERLDINEEITTGDIVAVKGGKITKNLVGAEQIMAVSHRPIVLGNMPEKEKIHLGNNIAFMGQIPVKIMGPVTNGDYIVAKGNVNGYGVAIHPKDMTIEDYKLVVGRSWESNQNPGAKMINTVVGVHNNDFLNIIGNMQKKVDDTDSRLKAIEEKLEVRFANSSNQKKTIK